MSPSRKTLHDDDEREEGEEEDTPIPVRPSVRPSLIETQKQKKTARALGPTSERMDGGREGGRDTQVAHIVHSRPAVQRAQRRRGPPRKGAGGGPRPRRDHCTANTCASEHVSGRRDAGVGSGRVADIAVKSDTRVGSATSVRPSVRPSVRLFIPACKLFVRMEGGAGSDGRRRRGGGGPATTWKLPPAARPDTHSPLA